MISTIILVIVRNLEIFFAEILVVDKTCPRKDSIFFQVCKYTTICGHNKCGICTGRLWSSSWHRGWVTWNGTWDFRPFHWFQMDYWSWKLLGTSYPGAKRIWMCYLVIIMLLAVWVLLWVVLILIITSLFPIVIFIIIIFLGIMFLFILPWRLPRGCFATTHREGIWLTQKGLQRLCCSTDTRRC